VGRIEVRGQSRQIVLENPSPKNQNGLEVWLKCKALCPNPRPTKTTTTCEQDLGSLQLANTVWSWPQDGVEAADRPPLSPLCLAPCISPMGLFLSHILSYKALIESRPFG
jgi:hypothetical protein